MDGILDVTQVRLPQSRIWRVLVVGVGTWLRAAERPKSRPERGQMHIALPCVIKLFFIHARYPWIKRPKHDTKLGCQARTWYAR